MTEPVAAPSTSAAADDGLTMTAFAPAARAAEPDRFHRVLSELNPLQYVPVVGTLYRSITGDTIPQSAREIGGLIFSGVVSGPFGVATSLATLAFEKITGIDPEAVGQSLLSDVGIGHAPAPTADEPQPLPLNTPTPTRTAGAAALAAPAAAASAAASAGAQTAPPATPVAWSPAQLTAYGVTKTAAGELKRGEVSGADVLNDLELARHQAAPPAT